MLKHRALVAEFLQTNYDKFFKHYANLLQTKNYATLRQALKLLSELLLGSLGFSMEKMNFKGSPAILFLKLMSEIGRSDI